MAQLLSILSPFLIQKSPKRASLAAKLEYLLPFLAQQSVTMGVMEMKTLLQEVPATKMQHAHAQQRLRDMGPRR